MICSKLHDCVESKLGSAHSLKCDNKNQNACIKSSDQRLFVKCEEKRKKYILKNTMKNHVISYKMDGGIIVPDKSVPNGTSKCDYLYTEK